MPAASGAKPTSSCEFVSEGTKTPFFLIHVENQATAQADFPERMFHYFALLTRKYHLPVYPVVIFSYDAPQRLEPDRYTVAFPDLAVLNFRYRVIQLNRLPWRRFVKQANPMASALMAKMKFSPAERPRVKMACLRLLGTLQLDPARTALIGAFIDRYLQLTAEMKVYERKVARLAPSERETTMSMISSWEQNGINQGLRQGKEGLVSQLIRRRFGSVTANMTKRLDALSMDQLDELGVALLDFATPADLEEWFTRRLTPERTI